jgi:N utilization substance protein B
MRRTDQRKEAVFALYQRDVTGRSLADLLEGVKPFSRELAEGVNTNLEAIDLEISSLSRGWSIERMAPLDRAILRVALYELLHSDGVPPEIAIDEAVSLAKEFCGADAPNFVNGILGAAARQAGVAT